MKKIITIIVALLCVIFVNAQITLTQADFGNQFFHAIQANDTLVDTATIHIGNPSASSQTWNFTTLHNHSTDSLMFMNASATPYASSFAAWDLAIVQSNSPGIYNFVSSNPSGVNIEGIGLNQGNITTTTPNEAVITYPPQTYMPFPSTYNSTFSGTTHSTIVIDTTFTYLAFTVDTVHDIHYITYNSVIDAWGTVTTPLGTFPCLRQEYTEHIIDSIYVHTTAIGWQFSTITQLDSNLSHRWYANGQGYPIAEITKNKSQTMDTTATWMMSSNTGIPGIDFASPTVSIFPNPASSEINIVKGFDRAVTVVIYDMIGNKISEQLVTDNYTKISVSQFASGFYSYRILDSNNTGISSGKFSIIR